MNGGQELVDDLDAAIERVRRGVSVGDPERRRALRDALACAYELRAYREGHTSETKTGYHARAAVSAAGRTTEGLTWIRGLMVHRVTRVQPEMQPLFPGSTTFPSANRFPGANLTWAPSSEIPQRAGAREAARRRLYDEHVADRLVLDVLSATRCFLATDPGPSSGGAATQDPTS